MVNRRLRVLLAVACLGALFAAAEGVEPRAPAARASSPTSADEEAIRQSSNEFERAFAAKDAAAVAAGWAPRGEFQNDSGIVLQGRGEVEKAYAALFANMFQPKAKVMIDSIRFPSKEMAVELGSIVVSHAGPELPTSTRYEAIHAREEGKWKLAFVREWHPDGHGLEELDWLVGKWQAKSGEEEYHFAFEWNRTKTYLLARYAKKQGGQTIVSGSQRIGVDPRTGLLHGWHFDEDGGFGESVWLRDRTSWLMDSVGVTADGARTASVSILTRVHDNEFTWRSVNRWMEEEHVPDSAPIRLLRVECVAAN